MKLSVIIPVYKVEDYIDECVTSVIAQKLENMEIILVDDGSPDKCPLICDKYSQQSEYIRVIHKKNGGLSSARNAGLMQATGDLIMFLDSDDWWNSNVDVREILRKIEQQTPAEMYLLSSLDYIEGAGLYKRREHEKLKNIRTASVEEYYRDLLANGNLEVHAATKILRRDFLVRNNLFFKEGILSEDNEWMLRLLRCLKSVVIIDEPLYVYRSGRVGSITNNVRIKNVADLLGIIEGSIAYYTENVNAPTKEPELCYCAYLWFSALGLSNQLTSNEKKQLNHMFKSTSVVCNYSNSPKTKLARSVYRLLGISLTSHVLGMYIMLKSKKTINKVKVDE